jgi:hypothetical protein
MLPDFAARVQPLVLPRGYAINQQAHLFSSWVVCVRGTFLLDWEAKESQDMTPQCTHAISNINGNTSRSMRILYFRGIVKCDTRNKQVAANTRIAAQRIRYPLLDIFEIQGIKMLAARHTSMPMADARDRSSDSKIGCMPTLAARFSDCTFEDTGPRRPTLFSKAARPAASCAPICYAMGRVTQED